MSWYKRKRTLRVPVLNSLGPSCTPLIPHAVHVNQLLCKNNDFLCSGKVVHRHIITNYSYCFMYKSLII
ncbi:uncharacterized protein DS421_10g289460 [Arachis hypogaea]|nr:uncharacterized protein DS421_10g289460 [Arachis hypogaea]